MRSEGEKLFEFGVNEQKASYIGITLENSQVLIVQSTRLVCGDARMLCGKSTTKVVTNEKQVFEFIGNESKLLDGITGSTLGKMTKAKRTVFSCPSYQLLNKMDEPIAQIVRVGKRCKSGYLVTMNSDSTQFFVKKTCNGIYIYMGDSSNGILIASYSKKCGGFCKKRIEQLQISENTDAALMTLLSLSVDRASRIQTMKSVAGFVLVSTTVAILIAAL